MAKPQTTAHVTKAKSKGPGTSVGLTKVVLQVLPKGMTVAGLKAAPRTDLETALGVEGTDNGAKFLLSTDESGAVTFTLKPGAYTIRGKTKGGLVAKSAKVMVAGSTCAVVLAVGG